MTFYELVDALTAVSVVRYRTAIENGVAPEDAMREIITVVLESYVERLAQ